MKSQFTSTYAQLQGCSCRFRCVCPYVCVVAVILDGPIFPRASVLTVCECVYVYVWVFVLYSFVWASWSALVSFLVGIVVVVITFLLQFEPDIQFTGMLWCHAMLRARLLTMVTTNDEKNDDDVDDWAALVTMFPWRNETMVKWSSATRTSASAWHWCWLAPRCTHFICGD